MRRGEYTTIRCFRLHGMLNQPLPLQDAEKAFQYGAQSIILSNHGGRELDLYVPVQLGNSPSRPKPKELN